MCFWDHLLVLPEEISLIWYRPMDLTKLAYLVYRHGGEAALVLAAYGTQA